jgi:hypothetical protein
MNLLRSSFHAASVLYNSGPNALKGAVHASKVGSDGLMYLTKRTYEIAEDIYKYVNDVTYDRHKLVREHIGNQTLAHTATSRVLHSAICLYKQYLHDNTILPIFKIAFCLDMVGAVCGVPFYRRDTKQGLEKQVQHLKEDLDDAERSIELAIESGRQKDAFIEDLINELTRREGQMDEMGELLDRQRDARTRAEERMNKMTKAYEDRIEAEHQLTLLTREALDRRQNEMHQERIVVEKQWREKIKEERIAVEKQWLRESEILRKELTLAQEKNEALVIDHRIFLIATRKMFEESERQAIQVTPGSEPEAAFAQAKNAFSAEEGSFADHLVAMEASIGRNQVDREVLIANFSSPDYLILSEDGLAQTGIFVMPGHA